ncbi:MAG: helix-turn-helix transcriptional regulator [Clostridia bacterium]|nr:helix-turn-helix transcriptional regulator [Clostridia bacterium]
MKDIYIAQKLLEKRKMRGITQEQLAEALAITPQSVSKWERGEGYPEITMLPAIADYFNTSVDEMLGTDTIRKNKDLQVYQERFAALIFSPEKRLNLTEQYYKKYPGNCEILSNLVYLLCECGFDKTKEEKKRIENLCNRILSESSNAVDKEKALVTLCVIAEKEDVLNYLNLCPTSYALQREELLETRLLKNGTMSDYSWIHEENDLRLLVYMLTKEVPRDPANAYTEYCRRRGVIEFLGIPEAWLGFFALLILKCSAALFALNRYEEGKVLFSDAIAQYEKWFEIEDGAPLMIGNDLFFTDLMTKKNDFFCYHKSATEKNFSVKNDVFLGNERGLHLILTRPVGWEWLDSFREDEFFKATVQRLESR